MCIVFYTVNPIPEREPKSFIVKIFKEDNNATRCIKTVNFPIRRPDYLNKVMNEANEYGRLSVKEIMDKTLGEQSWEG